MKELAAQPKLAEQVQDAILADISSGRLRAGERIIQEQVAQLLGVSRQPVQQALLLLRNKGVLRDAPGRGLVVASLDLDYVQSMYDVRAVIEGLAFRKAAEMGSARAREAGDRFIESGRKAVKGKSVRALIEADRKFHDFIYTLSGNPLIAPAMQAQWTYTQRVMGEVLMRDERPRDIWDQHEALLVAVSAGHGALAEKLAREHISQAATFMIARLRQQEADGSVVKAAGAQAG